jgi:antitoxin ParD1/3/4
MESVISPNDLRLAADDNVHLGQFLIYLLSISTRGRTMGMNINLTPQLEDLVRQKVASGLYTSASEVVREALRLMEEKDRLLGAKLDQLRQDIRDGVNSGPAEPWDPEEIKREGRARLAARKSAAGT